MVPQCAHGQPGVEREHRHLDGKSRPPTEDELRGVQSPARPHVKATMSKLCSIPSTQHDVDLEIQGQERQQHQCRPEQREQEELDRCVLTIRSAHTPIMKNIGKTKSKNTKNKIRSCTTNVPFIPTSRMSSRHKEEPSGCAVRESGSTIDDAQHTDERRQCEHRSRDAVDSDVIAGVDDVDPAVVDDESESARVVVVELQRDGELRRPAWRRAVHLIASSLTDGASG